ncbi:Sulfite reduction-associated complex DsrMKJOP protein DsrK (=HmeD), partial [hydrothermal vent metagenome]
MADFKVDKLTGKITIPKVDKGAALSMKLHPASEEHNKALGFPGKRVDNWQEKAIDKMGELLSKYKSLRVYMDICVRCGACADKCHYFIGTGDPNNMPVARQELMRKVYRKNFGAGRIMPNLSGSEDLTEDVLDEWWNYY